MTKSQIKNDDSIGTAWLEKDGTLKVDLQKSTEMQQNFHNLLMLKPSSPSYSRFIDHIGGISPGERKRVPAWPQTALETNASK
jgi:hypothetical protein